MNKYLIVYAKAKDCIKPEILEGNCLYDAVKNKIVKHLLEINIADCGFTEISSASIKSELSDSIINLFINSLHAKIKFNMICLIRIQNNGKSESINISHNLLEDAKTI